MSLIDDMKKRIAESGTNRKEILFFPPDTAKRIRFLQELDEGKGIEFHSDFNAGIMEPCKDPENHEECPHCQEGIKIKEQFFWSVWDYDSNSVKLINLRATGVTPVPAFIEYFETYGTIMDRDYKVKKVGKGMGGSFVVTPLDKEKFRNAKAKPYSEKKMMEIIEKAYCKEEPDEKEEKETKKKKNKKKVSAEDLLDQISFKEVKEVAYEIGMTKKEVKQFDDKEELVEELLDNYDDDDLKDLVEDMLYDREDDDEEEDDED